MLSVNKDFDLSLIEKLKDAIDEHTIKMNKYYNFLHFAKLT